MGYRVQCDAAKKIWAFGLQELVLRLQRPLNYEAQPFIQKHPELKAKSFASSRFDVCVCLD